MSAQAQAATAVATIDPRRSAVVADVTRMEKQFALALPEHVSPERFCRVVITAINSNPDLMRAERDSVLGAAMKCAQDGLLPDGKEAALVTYGTKAQYLPMIAGILTKVRRSGELKTINAHVVYEKDAFNYTLGDDEKIDHQPFMDGPRGKAIAVYAIAKTKDGGIYREVMSIEEVNQVRNVSRAKNNGPWVQWWGEMARKTVLRRLAKRLPMSTDLMQLFQRDDDHYDLTRQAEGAAKLRRLHADFDEPAGEAAEAEYVEKPLTSADVGRFDDTLGREVTDGDVAPEASKAQPKQAAGGFGAEPSANPEDPAPSAAVKWGRQLQEDLEADGFENAAAIDSFTADPDNAAMFLALEAENPAFAQKLNATLRGRRKALASREG